MIRPAAAFLAVLLAAGCDRPPAEPRAAANAAATFDNAAAAQSIIQPDVAAESPPEPAPSPSPTTTSVRTVTVPFATGSVLDAKGRASLDPLLADLPVDARLTVRGHSDSPGSDAANLTQSRRRADAVAAYLVAHGVDIDRIDVVALGEKRPIAPNANLDGTDDPEGRARNRRVEVEVIPTPPKPEPAGTPAAN